MKLLPIFILIISLSLSMPAQEKKTAFINGKIYTVDPHSPVVDAVIIQKNKIVFTGSIADAEKLIDSSTTIVDLNKKLMLPGFIDAHTHFFNGGFYLVGIDLRPAKSEEEFKSLLKEYIKLHPGKWVTGGYWDHERWSSGKMPSKELIDEISEDTPVFVDRIDGHVAVANSTALRIAGITKDTQDPDGGKIERDPLTGEPTGILKDNAMNLIQALIPPPSHDDYIEAGKAAASHLSELGITGIQDITIPEDFEILKELEKDGILKCRIYSRLPIEDYELAEQIRDNQNSSSLVSTSSLKAFSDGSLGASTAWFFEPYAGDEVNKGLASDIVLNGDFEKWVLEADLRKLQVCTHAIGDKANNYVLGVYKTIKDKNPQWDRRFRIEHAQHLRFEDIPLFSSIGVVASVQPYHAIDDGVWAEKRVGSERINFTHPYRTLLDNNVMVCFGTDWPIAPINPLLGIYAAVTRRTVDGKNPEGWIPDQKLTVEEAVKCYTLNSAYAGFSEKQTGSIEVGKMADFVVLSDDIFNIDPVKIKDVIVIMTVLNGKIVYKK